MAGRAVSALNGHDDTATGPAMTDSLPAAVHRIAARHARERGALLEVLHDLQRERGCIEPGAIPLVAAELNLTRADVYGVVTFYRDFHDAPARAQVRVCRAEACQAVGGEALAARARARLGVGFGETAGQVRLEEVFCLGNCGLGPAVEVDGTVYGRVDEGQLDSLLARVAAR